MLLYRTATDGDYVVQRGTATPRLLLADPWTIPRGQWPVGEEVDLEEQSLLAPVTPSKIVGIGRNYVEHAAELGNPMPEEPLIFLKAPSSILAPGAAIVLPPESERVELEGEIALVIGSRLRRADRSACAAGIFGVTIANDVTARDLQRRDKTFARGKSFDTFCPVGPAIWLGDDLEALRLDALSLETRLDGQVVQRGAVSQMAWGPIDLVEYVSRHMTLLPGDLLPTGTPAGVTPLEPGQTVEVAVNGIGVLSNPVVAGR